ncbi:unnamed protein product [Adineta steineri]|uniref:Uncharacterized protein n=1 Tax=Adineta steineri TaxID=433720 RepID=A0A813UG56_9BILA|nr:unnamed protein product [Adineta steineri]
MVYTMKFICLLFVVALMVASNSVWATSYSARHHTDMEQTRRELVDRFLALLGKREYGPGGKCLVYGNCSCDGADCRNCHSCNNGRPRCCPGYACYGAVMNVGACYPVEVTAEFNKDHVNRPCVYRNTRPPLNDLNLLSLCAHTSTKCVFAHIRAGSDH